MLSYTIPLPQVPPPLPPSPPALGPPTPQGPNSPFSRGVVWLLKVSTATVGIAVGRSEQMQHLVEYGINATYSKAKDIKGILQRDERKHVQALVSATDSLQMGVPPMTAPPVTPLPEATSLAQSPILQVDKHYSRRQTAHKLTSRSSHQSVTPSQQLLAQSTYAEQQRLLGIQEGNDWGKYISDSNLQKRRNAIGQTVIHGNLYSLATVATYKEMVLHVRFTLKSGEVREENEMIREFLLPGGSVPVKVKFRTPAHTIDVEYNINGAGYLLPH